MSGSGEKRDPHLACILNCGSAAWVFESIARHLADGLGVDISTTPRMFNYVLGADAEGLPSRERLFIDPDAMRIASDKRLLALTFAHRDVPVPETRLFDELAAVHEFTSNDGGREWCLKYPTANGARGHRILSADTEIPEAWPKPYIVQEFIRLERPEVFRSYAAGGELFGWLARRYRDGRGSPWVAHAAGAHWETLPGVPDRAREAAWKALAATNLLETFGCVDMLQRPNGEWLVLEVGTDGLASHVDRDLGDPRFEAELLTRIRESFWLRFDKVRSAT